MSKVRVLPLRSNLFSSLSFPFPFPLLFSPTTRRLVGFLCVLIRFREHRLPPLEPFCLPQFAHGRTWNRGPPMSVPDIRGWGCGMRGAGGGVLPPYNRRRPRVRRRRTSTQKNFRRKPESFGRSIKLLMSPDTKYFGTPDLSNSGLLGSVDDRRPFAAVAVRVRSSASSSLYSLNPISNFIFISSSPKLLHFSSSFSVRSANLSLFFAATRLGSKSRI